MELKDFFRFSIMVRRKLIYFVLLFVVLFLGFFQVSGFIIEKIRQDFLPHSAKLIATGMMETIMVEIQIAAILSLVVLGPASALFYFRKRISKNTIIWFVSSIILLIIGFSFTYFFFLPTTINVLTLLTIDASVSPYYSINKFIFFTFFTIIIFCLIFQMPLLIIWLVLRGIIDIETLKQKRRHFYVAIFVISAVVTGPTALTQILLAVPLIFLYELSIFVSGYLLKLRK